MGKLEPGKHFVRFSEAFCDMLKPAYEEEPTFGSESYCVVNVQKNNQSLSYAIYYFGNGTLAHYKRSDVEKALKNHGKKVVKSVDDIEPFITHDYKIEAPIFALSQEDFWVKFTETYQDKPEAVSEKSPATLPSISEESMSRIVPSTFMRKAYNHLKEATPKPSTHAAMTAHLLWVSFDSAKEKYEGYNNTLDPFWAGISDKQINKNESERTEQDIPFANKARELKGNSYERRQYYLGSRALSKSADSTKKLQKKIIQEGISSEESSPMSLKYLDAESCFNRTTKSTNADGTSAQNSASGGADLICFNTQTQRPVLVEYKSETDGNLLYAFLQGLTYCSELAHPHQLKRFAKSYPVEEVSNGIEIILMYDAKHNASLETEAKSIVPVIDAFFKQAKDNSDDESATIERVSLVEVSEDGQKLELIRSFPEDGVTYKGIAIHSDFALIPTGTELHPVS